MTPRRAARSNKIVHLSAAQRTKIISSAFLSNFLEFYDFCLMGTFIVKLSSLFFPGPELASVLKGLSVFGISFFARPLGALFFGFIGDHFGRKTSLIFSTVLMGVSTFFIGCLPSYETWGVVSSVILIVLRMLQGFSLGGESSGSFLFLLESVKKHQGLLSSLVLAFGTLGMLVSNACGIIFLHSNAPAWAWRVPFLMGILLAFLSLYLRLSLKETQDFEVHRRKKARVLTLFLILTQHKRTLLIIFCVGFVNATLVYMLVVYVALYISQFTQLSASDALIYPQGGMILCLLLVPIAGKLCDRISACRVMKIGCFLMFLSIPLIALALLSHSFMLVCFLLSMLIGFLNAPAPLFLYELLPVNVRYTGVSFGFSLGAAFGALTPFYLVFLQGQFSSIELCIALYLFVLCCVSFLAINGGYAIKGAGDV